MEIANLINSRKKQIRNFPWKKMSQQKITRAVVIRDKTNRALAYKNEVKKKSQISIAWKGGGFGNAEIALQNNTTSINLLAKLFASRVLERNLHYQVSSCHFLLHRRLTFESLRWNITEIFLVLLFDASNFMISNIWHSRRERVKKTRSILKLVKRRNCCRGNSNFGFPKYLFTSMAIYLSVCSLTQ